MSTRPFATIITCLLLASCARTESLLSERMIDIGTHELHVRIMGEGSPAVVIDAAIAARSEEWHPIQDRLAAETAVFVYDRAGYGNSWPGPMPRDSGTAMDELKALLEAAAVQAPYVMVGHSLGGLNLQVYRSRYPEDVAGLVLLDPPPLEWIQGKSYPGLIEMAEQLTAEWQTIADLGAQAPSPEQAVETAFFRTIASEHREMLGKSAQLAAEIETFGNVPLIVIASGVPNPAFGDIAQEYQQYWIAQSRALAGKSTRGEFVLATESTHMLHDDVPEMVLDSIRKVLVMARTR